MNQSMSLRPRVGISADFWTFPSGHVSDCGPAFDRVKQAYSLHVAQRGALPLVLPNLHDEGMVNDYLVLLDGLLLHGGADVHPTHYRQELRYSDCHIQPLRDAFELPLVRRAVEIGLPIFGICRGLQVINIALGGTLYQDRSLCPGAVEHRAHKPFDYRRHEVVAVPGTCLARLIGRASWSVGSSHHQMIEQVAPSLVASAHAPDGVVEAVEGRDESRFLLGVQWHPEDDGGTASEALFDAFLAAVMDFHDKRVNGG